MADVELMFTISDDTKDFAFIDVNGSQKPWRPVSTPPSPLDFRVNPDETVKITMDPKLENWFFWAKPAKFVGGKAQTIEIEATAQEFKITKSEDAKTIEFQFLDSQKDYWHYFLNIKNRPNKNDPSLETLITIDPGVGKPRP